MEGVANLILIAMAIVGGAAFLALFRFRPRNALSPASLSLSALVYLATGYIAFTAARAVGDEIIELRVLDPNGQPLSEVQVTFEHAPRGGGFAALRPASSGSIQTDSTGTVLITTDRRHETWGRIAHPGFTEVTYRVHRDWGGDRRQFKVTWLDPRMTHRNGDSIRTKDIRSFDGFITAGHRATLTVFLPNPGHDEPLPYPKQ